MATAKKSAPTITLYQFSLAVSLVLSLLVLSFKKYFLFIPNFGLNSFALPLLQIFSGIGWIILILFPPFYFRYINSKIDKKFLLISILIWPVATFLIKIALFVQTGSWFLSYLSAYPIFIFMEILAPAIYIWIYRNIK